MSLAFEKRVEKSHGGIPCDMIELVPSLKVSFPNIIDGKYTDAPSLSVGTGWDEFHFIEKSGRFVETLEIINGAEVYVQELSCVINGTSALAMSQLLKIKRKKLQIKFRDRSGVYKIMGGAGTYASLIINSRDNKNLPDERRETPVVFRSISSIPASELP